MSELRTNRSQDLWICPRCGEQVRGMREVHHCGVYSAATLFSAVEPQVFDLYLQFEAMATRTEEVEVLPRRKWVEFAAGRIIATVEPWRDHLRVAFCFPRPDRNPRFVSIEHAGPGEWLHKVRVTREGDMDREFEGWLERSRG